MNFTHDLITLGSIEQVNSDTGRFYRVPNGGEYKSITTVLSGKSKDAIEKWRSKVGDKAADGISNRASSIGNELHSLCEHHLANKPVKCDNPIILNMFKQVQKRLDANVDQVLGIELPMWSDRLKIAGTCDAVLNYKGKITILDFKTSKKPKKIEWIESYFWQCTFYSLALEELTGIRAEHIFNRSDHIGNSIPSTWSTLASNLF